MGRTQVTKRYEITPEIKELQNLAHQLSASGHGINVDITQDLVVFNGYRKMNRVEAKAEMLRMIEAAKNPMVTSDFPDQEQIQKEERAKAKAAKKHREPGAPPELRTVIRRAKRIFKKATVKGIAREMAIAKVDSYIDRKLSGEDFTTATTVVTKYIEAN